STDLGESSLIMAIGGGSVEFIFCSMDEIFWKKSFPVGAAKLMAAFHHSDPISDTDIKTVKDHLAIALAELKSKAIEFKPNKLVGSAGAFETFAALETSIFKQSNEFLKSDNYIFDPLQLKQVLKQLISSDHDERAANELIIPVRTDMIVVASILTEYILEFLNMQHITMSRYSLKEGLLLQGYAELH
ncbi:MAG: exopolyphosphatase, partial [Sphingobacteriales bacterium]